MMAEYAEAVATDLSELVGEPVCHIFRGRADVPPAARPFALCGVPRAEQPVHGSQAPLGTLGRRLYCPSCGCRVCPECARRSLA